MNLDERIAQFRNMAEADPDNEMAHFSLGNALLQAGRPAEAAPSFMRCIKVNPDMSKAYQLAGNAYIAAENPDAARDVLLDGYRTAGRKGDLMPKTAIRDMLVELGAEIPEVREAESSEVPSGTFMCQATGRPGTQLEKPPFRGALGQKIYESVSAETWREWIGQGTKVINELRLDLSREDHSRLYDQHMIEFLGLDAWASEHLQESS